MPFQDCHPNDVKQIYKNHHLRKEFPLPKPLTGSIYKPIEKSMHKLYMLTLLCTDVQTLNVWTYLDLQMPRYLLHIYIYLNLQMFQHFQMTGP